MHETVRRMINALALNLIRHSTMKIAEAGITSLEDIRRAAPLISFSTQISEENQELKRFLRSSLYQHFQVIRMTTKAERIISSLFGALSDEPRLLPPEHQEKARKDKFRAVADYVAGMTDRYAIKEYRRLFEIGEEN